MSTPATNTPISIEILHQAVLANNHGFIRYVLATEPTLVNGIYHGQSILLWAAQYSSLNTLRLLATVPSTNLTNCITTHSDHSISTVSFLIEYVKTNLARLQCNYPLRCQLAKLINDLMQIKPNELALLVNMQPTPSQSMSGEKDLLDYCHSVLNSRTLVDAIFDAGCAVVDASMIVNNVDEDEAEDTPVTIYVVKVPLLPG